MAAVSDAARLTFQQGQACHERGQLAEAERLYEDALRLQPTDFNTLYMLALVAFQTQRPERGIALTEQAIAVNPKVAEAHNNLANGLMELRRFAPALASYDQAIALKPLFAEAHNNRGAALNALGRHAEAAASCEKATALKANYPQAHYNRGLALKALGRLDEALASYDRALALYPDYAEAWNNRAIVLNDLNRPAEALVSCDKAIALVPDYAEAHHNRGAALSDLGRHEEALASYDRALALAPDYAEPHLNKGVLLLLLGRFVSGLSEFEWRKRLPEPVGARFPEAPLWLGKEDVAGKVLLLHCEQGLGDTIQFCRYARLLEARGARVILLVQPPLKSLLQSLSPTIEVIAEGEPLPDFDRHCPLMSLPLAFGTTLETIPAERRYLAADAAKRVEWRAGLGPKTKMRIGIAWSGNAAQSDDHNRSMPLATLLPLLAPQVEWLSLQRELRDSDAAILRQRGDIAFFGTGIEDFSDTAALIEETDLVITVDTAVAHLAGALGKPVWIALSANAAWRWLLARSDSPWYPGARLFRQSAIGDWAPVIAAIESALRAHIG